MTRSKRVALLLLLCISALLLLKWNVVNSVVLIYLKLANTTFSPGKATTENTIIVYPASPSDLGSFEQLKPLAKNLLELPPHERRQSIISYNLYSRYQVDDSYKLLILMRLLFSVPEEYSEEDGQVFDGFFGQRITDQGNYNCLWPLGYDENGKLILKYISPFWECYGLCPYYYDGAKEYDFFAARFQFRDIKEIK